MLYHSRKAITFLEIVIAVAVMLMAMVPLFGVISRQTVETERNASQAFAINKATEVLNTILDNVAFAALREGNPGYIKVSDLPQTEKYEDYNQAWAKKMASMLFNSTKEDSAGFPCQGIITDSKGISYLIHMRIEGVYSILKKNKPERIKIGDSYPTDEPTEFGENPEVTFSFLKNPSMLTSSIWTQDFAETADERNKPLTELEIPEKGVSESPINIYNDENIDSLKSATKYSFINPTAERFTAKMVMSKVPYETEAHLSWCPFKRLVCQVQWNLDPQYYSDPASTKGNIQRIHLMTIKADLD